MAIKDDVLRRLLEEDKPCSGSALAESLGVSRSAVWKAIEQLREIRPAAAIVEDYMQQADLALQRITLS